MRRVLIVFLGGGGGAALRGLLLAWLAPWGAVVPLPVLLANVLGAFLLAIVVVLADETGLLRVETRLFLAVGVLGGFTTFSTLDWGADLLLAQGPGTAGVAFVYLVASVMGGFVAVSGGFVAGRALVALVARRVDGRRGRREGRGPRRAGNVQAEIAAVEAEDREESA